MKAKKIHIGLLIVKLLVAFLFISSFRLFEQQPDTATAQRKLTAALELMENEQYEEAKALLLEAAAIFEQTKSWEEYIQTVGPLDDCFNALGLYEEGIDFFSRAIQINPSKEKTEQFRAEIWLRLALNYHSSGQYKEALLAYEKGLPFAEKRADTDRLISYYGSLGYLYWENGNHEKALDIQQKSLQLALQANQLDHAAIVMQGIGDSYHAMQKKDSSFYWFRRSVALRPEAAQTYIQFSKAYQDFGLADSALWALSKAIPLLTTESEKADGYYQYARLHSDQKAFATAARYIDQAIRFGEIGYGAGHSEMARILRMAGMIYQQWGKEEQALAYYQQVLDILSHTEQPLAELTQFPPVETLEPGSFWVMDALSGKGYAFLQLFYKTGDVEPLHLAMRHFEAGISYAEKMRLEHSYSSSKLEFYAYVQPVIEGAIKTALALAEATQDPSYQEKAFLLSERSKAAVLSEELYDNEVKHIAGVPDKVLEEGRLLQEKVNTYTIDAYHESALYNDSLREARILLDRWKKNLEKSYPRYYALKYAYSRESEMASIRSKMKEGDVLVQYFVGTDTLYSFALSTRSLYSYKTPLDGAFKQALQDFRKTTGDWQFVSDSTEVAERLFLTSATQLYDKLLARPLQQIQAKSLIIVPDGQLGLIPFGALLEKEYAGSWRSLDVPYLIKKYAVSYTWAASFDGHNNENSQQPDYGFGGFGSEYDQTTLDLLNGDGLQQQSAYLALRDFGRLPFADDEIKSVLPFMRGKSWLNAEATKKQFLENAPRCGVIHVAAHGIIDEDNPMLSHLVFNRSNDDKDIRLYAAELYNTRLRARLAVLSACNSGNGQIQLGEGVMSLARSFTYAGCPSLVTSLWKVSDLSAATLMAPFYQQLRKGLPIDQALRAAQLQYLSSTSSAYSLPVYWSGFVVIGSKEALPESYFKHGYSWWWALLPAGLAIAAGLYYRRKA